MKQVLTPEQMRHLNELGLNASNASMCWLSYNEINTVLPRNFQLPISDKDYEICDAYTLADIIEMLPKQIEDRDGYQNYIVIYHDGKMWVVSYSSEDEEYSEMGYQYHYESGIELIDAAYEMLCWCLENKYIETKEK